MPSAPRYATFPASSTRPGQREQDYVSGMTHLRLTLHTKAVIPRVDVLTGGRGWGDRLLVEAATCAMIKNHVVFLELIEILAVVIAV